MMPIDRCIEVFAKGLTFTRSLTKPCIASQIDGAWWLRDDPTLRERRRNDEWITRSSIDVGILHRLAHESTKSGFTISAVTTNAEEEVLMRARFRKLGYRLWRTEPLMTRSTEKTPRFDTLANVRLVETDAIPSRRTNAQEGSTISKKLWKGSPTRCHVAMLHERVAGWARSISVNDSSWCDSMFVEPEFRRRGIGRALVVTMLRADRAAGLSASVLAARHAGAKLYSSVGYQTAGTVLVLTPLKR